MARRRIVVIGLLLTSLAAGACYWSGEHTGPRLRVENYPQVRVWLSQAEVEGLLEGSPGNYGRYARDDGCRMTLEGYRELPGSVERIRCDDANRFEIYFDPEGRVVGNHRRAGYQQTPRGGLLAALRRQFGLWARDTGGPFSVLFCLVRLRPKRVLTPFILLSFSFYLFIFPTSPPHLRETSVEGTR